MLANLLKFLRLVRKNNEKVRSDKCLQVACDSFLAVTDVFHTLRLIKNQSDAFLMTPF